MAVPDDLDETITSYGVFIPPQVSPDEAFLYDRMMEGKCVTCGAELGNRTWAILGRPIGLDRTVVIMLFCGGACFTDFQVLGWIQEQHADIAQQVAFRGGAGDEAEDKNS